MSDGDVFSAPIPAASDAGYSAELHLFHFRSHSMVWSLTLHHRGSCSTTGEHVHTPQGRDMYVFCDVHLTRDAAEARIADVVAQHAEFGEVLGPVQVVHHRDDVRCGGC